MTKGQPKPPSGHAQPETLSVELQVAFGESVRAARVEAGMTQAELSERAAVSRDDISRIEHGKINLTIATMSKLAAVFDGDVAKMLQAHKARARGQSHKG